MNSALFYLAHWGQIDRDGEETDMGAKKSFLMSMVTVVASVPVLVGSAYAGGGPDLINSVPEPGTLVLLSTGLGGALAWRWFRKRR